LLPVVNMPIEALSEGGCEMRVVIVLASTVWLASGVAPLRAQQPDRADAAYAAKQYAEAIPLYAAITRSGASEAVRARAQLRIGYCWYKLHDEQKARSA
jgi:hypothetical protein